MRDPETAADIQWSGKIEKLFVLCSKQMPAVAWPAAQGIEGETFEFGGTGVPGVQEDNAHCTTRCVTRVIQAGVAMLAGLGYLPLPGGGAQFQIRRPEELLER